MASLTRGRLYISRAELAQFVVDQFSLFSNVRITPTQQITQAHPASLSQLMGAGPWSSHEWRFGETPNACNIKNTCLAFLWSPAPGVWQPAFRARNRLRIIKREPSTPPGLSEP